MSAPYYEDELVTLYHGDCHEFIVHMTAPGRWRRAYDVDGTAEDQWAPCGGRADTCPKREVTK